MSSRSQMHSWSGVDRHRMNSLSIETGITTWKPTCPFGSGRKKSRNGNTQRPGCRTKTTWNGLYNTSRPENKAWITLCLHSANNSKRRSFYALRNNTPTSGRDTNVTKQKAGRVPVQFNSHSHSLADLVYPHVKFPNERRLIMHPLMIWFLYKSSASLQRAHHLSSLWSGTSSTSTALPLPFPLYPCCSSC